jgi:hypothetical protein
MLCLRSFQLHNIRNQRNRDSSVGSQQGHEMLFFYTASRPAVGPMHPPIQWVTEFFTRRQIDRGVKLTHLHLVLRSRMMELYLHSHTRLYGVVLNELSTGTDLPLPKKTNQINTFVIFSCSVLTKVK